MRSQELSGAHDLDRRARLGYLGLGKQWIFLSRSRSQLELLQKINCPCEIYTFDDTYQALCLCTSPPAFPMGPPFGNKLRCFPLVGRP